MNIDELVSGCGQYVLWFCVYCFLYALGDMVVSWLFPRCD